MATPRGAGRLHTVLTVRCVVAVHVTHPRPECKVCAFTRGAGGRHHRLAAVQPSQVVLQVTCHPVVTEAVGVYAGAGGTVPWAMALPRQGESLPCLNRDHQATTER